MHIRKQSEHFLKKDRFLNLLNQFLYKWLVIFTNKKLVRMMTLRRCSWLLTNCCCMRRWCSRCCREQGSCSRRNWPYADPKTVLRDASCGRLISSKDSNDCSTKQDAVKQAEVLGVNIKTMDYWLTKFVNSGDLQRIMNGKYQKENVLIAW